jgi:formate hydrogenlyase subunit 6/NADH:ubiquinone oxidoreductase subunit I
MSPLVNAKSSVFGTLWRYLVDVAWAIRSVWGSCVTAVPYLFSAGEYRKEVTEQYPDPISSKTADDLPPRSRGLLYNDIDRCTGCRECEKVCPAKCIRIENEPGSDPSKIWVAVFDIDFARCIFCGLCVDICAPASLVHTRQYEGAVYEATDLVKSYGRGHVTIEQREKWAQLRQMSDSDEVMR